jgi:hypothetical protein
MKKLILFILASLIFSGMKANIMSPQAYISEILVDSAGNWSLEMGFYGYDNSMIDSVKIITSSGSSIIAFYDINLDGNASPYDSLAVISNDNLVSPLAINASGDFVRLISYGWDYEAMDEIAFGNFPGSFLDCMQSGESVSCSDWVTFCINSSPSIGSGNQSDNCKGNFSGFILDPLGNPLTGGYIVIKLEKYNNLVLEPDANGYFNDEILSRRYTFDTIEHHYPPYPHTDLYVVQPVDFCLRPDSAHYQDIIATDLIEGVPDQETKEQTYVTIAPNPFSDNVVFYFNLNKIEDNDLIFSIYSLDGKTLEQIQLAPGQNRLEWKPSADIPRGTYIYRLKQHQNLLQTGKFVRL